MMPPAGQPTASMMPPVVEHVNMGLPDSAPPEYSLGFEDEIELLFRCYHKKRKVYLTLMVQLLITVGIICAFLYWETLKDWVRDTYWFTYTMMLICCGDIRRKVPLNFIFLALFTITEGFLLGSAVVYYSAEAVLWAVGATALVSLAMSLFPLQSKWDFTALSGSIWVLCWTLFSFALLYVYLFILIHADCYVSKYLYILYASLGTLIFSVYLVMDTELILGGKHKYSISPEEYIFATLNLYLDIITIFLLLLQLFGFCR
uniref:Zgc:110410 n=1 Tax=Sinocyclocheilus anshuiensis TaxID=1608454 RepID=A0A671PX81_9TELE